MIHGHGTFNSDNGDVYVGQWRTGNEDGRGEMTYANKDIYNGQWKDGVRDGQGTMKYHNGDVYEGEFSKDKMHGKGSYTYAAGDLSKSTGEWKEGKKCGLFENIARVRVEVSEQVHYDYDDDELKPDSNVNLKREDSFDANIDNLKPFDANIDTPATAIGAVVAMLALPLLKFLGL